MNETLKVSSEAMAFAIKLIQEKYDLDDEVLNIFVGAYSEYMEKARSEAKKELNNKKPRIIT